MIIFLYVPPIYESCLSAATEQLRIFSHVAQLLYSVITKVPNVRGASVEYIGFYRLMFAFVEAVMCDVAVTLLSRSGRRALELKNIVRVLSLSCLTT